MRTPQCLYIMYKNIYIYTSIISPPAFSSALCDVENHGVNFLF